jgi:hypothetical protein
MGCDLAAKVIQKWTKILTKIMKRYAESLHMPE